MFRWCFAYSDCFFLTCAVFFSIFFAHDCLKIFFKKLLGFFSAPNLVQMIVLHVETLHLLIYYPFLFESNYILIFYIIQIKQNLASGKCSFYQFRVYFLPQILKIFVKKGLNLLENSKRQSFSTLQGPRTSLKQKIIFKDNYLHNMLGIY